MLTLKIDHRPLSIFICTSVYTVPTTTTDGRCGLLTMDRQDGCPCRSSPETCIACPPRNLLSRWSDKTTIRTWAPGSTRSTGTGSSLFVGRPYRPDVTRIHRSDPGSSCATPNTVVDKTTSVTTRSSGTASDSPRGTVLRCSV